MPGRRPMHVWVAVVLLLFLIGAAAGAKHHVTCDVEDHRTLMCDGVEYKSDKHDIPGSADFYIHLGLCVAMVIFAGMPTAFGH